MRVGNYGIMSVVMPGCISRQFARGVGRSGRKQPRIVVLSSSLFRFALLVKRTELRAVRRCEYAILDYVPPSGGLETVMMWVT